MLTSGPPLCIDQGLHVNYVYLDREYRTRQNVGGTLWDILH
jgi:hypothetical protein